MRELAECTCCTEDFCDSVPTPLGELLCLLTPLPLACSGTAGVMLPSVLDCWCTDADGRGLGGDVCVCSKG